MIKINYRYCEPGYEPDEGAYPSIKAFKRSKPGAALMVEAMKIAPLRGSVMVASLDPPFTMYVDWEADQGSEYWD